MAMPKGSSPSMWKRRTGAPLLLMSGAEGDVAPIYSTITMPHAMNQGLNHLSQFKVLLGDRILSANRSVAATDDRGQAVDRDEPSSKPRSRRSRPFGIRRQCAA